MWTMLLDTKDMSMLYLTILYTTKFKTLFAEV